MLLFLVCLLLSVVVPLMFEFLLFAFKHQLSSTNMEMASEIHYTLLSAEAAKLVRHPRKVECLNGVYIILASLGSEHSIAVTGLDLYV